MIERLEMFIALANAGHFGRAAGQLGVTQPTLSSAIKALEDQLGVQLVRRGSRYEGLTAEGEKVLERALRIVADTRALKAEMRAIRRGGLEEELRIGVIPTALPVVGELTAPLLARHPGLRLTVLSRSAAEIEAQIDRLELDAGLTYLGAEALVSVPAVMRAAPGSAPHAALPGGEGQVMAEARAAGPEPGTAARPGAGGPGKAAAPRGRATLALYRESHALLVSAGMELPEGPMGWAEIGRLPLCLLTPDMRNRQIVDRHLAAAGVTVVPQVESSSIIVLLGHVLTGRFATVVPSATADLFGLSGRLRVLPVADPTPGPLVGLILSDREPRAPGLEALVSVAQERAIEDLYHLTGREY